MALSCTHPFNSASYAKRIISRQSFLKRLIEYPFGIKKLIDSRDITDDRSRVPAQEDFTFRIYGKIPSFDRLAECRHSIFRRIYKIFIDRCPRAEVFNAMMLTCLSDLHELIHVCTDRFRTIICIYQIDVRSYSLATKFRSPINEFRSYGIEIPVIHSDTEAIYRMSNAFQQAVFSYDIFKCPSMILVETDLIIPFRRAIQRGRDIYIIFGAKTCLLFRK